jgi:hypothetical protein
MVCVRALLFSWLKALTLACKMPKSSGLRSSKYGGQTVLDHCAAMLFSRDFCVELAVCAVLLEYIVPLRIRSREPGNIVPAKQRLVTVGGDLFTV